MESLDNTRFDTIEVGDLVQVLGQDEWFSRGMEHTVGETGTVTRIFTNEREFGLDYCERKELNPKETAYYHLQMRNPRGELTVWAFQYHNVKLVKKKNL